MTMYAALTRLGGFITRHENGLKGVGVLIAAIWALFLYYDHRYDLRVQQTLKYVERFHGEELAEAREVTEGYWHSLEGVAILFAKSDVDLRAQAVERVRKENLEKPVLKMYDFYAEVTLCARNAHCELASACSYFRDSVYNFRELHLPLIEVWGIAARDDLDAPVLDFLTDCDADSIWRQIARYVAL